MTDSESNSETGKEIKTETIDNLKDEFEDRYCGTNSFGNIRKTCGYVNAMFLQKKFFLAEIDKNRDRNNKQTSRCYGNIESSHFACSVKFFINYIFSPDLINT